MKPMKTHLRMASQKLTAAENTSGDRQSETKKGIRGRSFGRKLECEGKGEIRGREERVLLQNSRAGREFWAIIYVDTKPEI